MVTRSKREAIDEEKEIVALAWLIDMGSLKIPISEDSAVKLNDGNQFNFNDEVSMKTTRFASDEKSTTSAGYAMSTPPQGKYVAVPISPVSILRPTGGSLVYSGVSQEKHRLGGLESNVTNINTKLDTMLKMMMNNQAKENQEPNTLVTPPTSVGKGGQGP